MGLENDDEKISGPETGTQSLGNWEDDLYTIEADLAEINELSRLKSSNDVESKSSNFNEDDEYNETDFEEMDFEDENKEKINMLESMSYDQLRNQLDKIPYLITMYSDDEIQKDIEDIEDILIYKDDMSDEVEDFLRLSLKLFKARLKPPNPPKIAKK